MKNGFVAILLVLGMACACGDDSQDVLITDEKVDTIINIDVPDWTEATHSRKVDPNYDIVFAQNKVLRVDIKLSATEWTRMQADLVTNLGTSTGGGPGGNGGGGGVIALDFTPVWAESTITFEGKDWYKVGIRYKGNSTLSNTYKSGESKYSFKLDFDQFEDTYPAIKNQRFYGFKQLNLGNNFDDASGMREKVSADLFREFGVPAAQTSFAAVYLDKGNGSEYLGLYTIVEEVDNSLAESQFPNKEGNMYKPDGTGASFAAGSYADADMGKASNEDEADFTDIKALYDLLNNASRTTNVTQWQIDLESIFDVDGYLKYLAVNNVIQNWDTYGKMTHNFFLYNNDGKLTWVPWDNNEALQTGKMGGALSLSMSEVTSQWPLIRYIMDVPVYKSKYDTYLQSFVDGAFDPTKMQTLYTQYESLLASYAAQENVNISSAVTTLKSHVTQRKQAVVDYLK
jgi:spore coat protein H